MKVLEEKVYAEEAYFNLGNVYSARAEKSLRKTKWRNKALESYKKALLLNPNNAAAINNMADVLVKEKQYEKAISFLSEIAKPGVPDSEYYLSTLGDAYKDLGQYEDALDAYCQAEKEALKESAILDKEYLSALYLSMAEFYNELGEPKKVGIFKRKADALVGE